MKSKTLHKDKVNIITLGCSKNLVDSEVLSGQLKASDIDVVHENTKLDHNEVVVNTCGFIAKAHVFVISYMVVVFVSFETSTTYAHKCNTVSMFRI